MSFGVFAVLFVLGAGMLAVWVDARFPKLAPGDLRTAVLHLGGGLVANSIAAPVISGLVAGTHLPGARLVAVVGIALPALAYVALAVFWIAKLLQDPLRSMSR